MPIKQRDGKWYWGKQGPFNSREKAVEVAQAAYSSGYKAKDMEKSWITNPRGDGKNVKGDQKYTVYNKKRYETASEFIQKEGGDGGGDGGSFGGGAGTVFTSETAGIFTPTHSERSKRKKNNKKPPTGIDRLNDFITERSPERKMQKGFAWDLVDWVRKELKKADELQSDRVDDNTWKTEKNPIEFDAEPDKHAAEEQLAEEARIKRLDDEGDDNTPETGQASDASPAGLPIQFGWDVGSSQADELAAGGDQDTLYEEEDEDRTERDLRKAKSPFLQKLLADLDK